MKDLYTAGRFFRSVESNNTVELVLQIKGNSELNPLVEFVSEEKLEKINKRIKLLLRDIQYLIIENK
jgi:nitrogen regulatory protein PII-like uncharacterized protein